MTTAQPSTSPTVRSLLGTADSPELALRRRYRAAPEEVLAACTDVGRLARWFGQVEGDPAAVGDAFTVRFRGAEEEPATGEVRACAAEGLSISWTWQGDAESVISLRVAEAAGGESELTLLHVLAEPEHVAGYGGGWEQQLDALARHLAGEEQAAEGAESDEDAEQRAVATWEAMTVRPLVIRRHVTADLERVWTALASTEGIQSWWWSHRGDVTVDADAAPGTRYRVTSPSAGIELEGTYLIVDRPRRLSATWQWREAGITSRDETVDIALDPGDGGTEITLRHTGPWLDDPVPNDHWQGWEDTLAALERSLLPH